METVTFLNSVTHFVLLLCGVLALVGYTENKENHYLQFIAYLALIWGLMYLFRELMWLI